MADQKISQLTTIVTVDNASDLFPIVDTSAAETKKITPTALKTALALNNVDNTSDANKPVSSATQSALNAKQDTLVSGTNIKTINGTSVLGSGNISISSAVAWGGVTGTLSNQTDLQTALDGKVDENTAITGATKTKVTYDSKGLVTAGADATTADIADSTNKRYVTDAQLVVVGNTSGTNTGDNATNSQYSGLAASKQDTLVSGTNIKTINSTSILGSGDIVIGGGSPSGVSGAIQFSDGSAFASDATNLFWDDTNNRLGVGLNTPATTLDILPPVQTATATQFDCFRVGYSNSTIGITNGSALQVQVATTGSGRYSTTLRLSGSSDTSQAYLKGFAANNFGVMLNRANSNLGLFSDNGIKLGDTAFAGSEGAASGMVHIKGSGSTFATNSFLVQNNSGTNLMRIRDDGQVFCEGGGAFSSAGIIGTIYGLFGGASYEASASLVCGGTTQGFLPPRMTNSQRTSISSPAVGLMVYCTDTVEGLYVYKSTGWTLVI